MPTECKVYRKFKKM